jgi:hypothetical protein
MTNQEILLQVYLLSKAVNHNLFFLKQNGILDKELKDAINQLSAKTSYFNKQIESTLFSNMKKVDLDKQEEFTYEILEFLEQTIKRKKT